MAAISDRFPESGDMPERREDADKLQEPAQPRGDATPPTVHAPCGPRNPAQLNDERITELFDPYGAGSGRIPEPGELVRGSEQTEIVQPPQAVAQDRCPGAPGKVGRYELRKKLGSGAFGEVWVAYDAVLRRMVATKIPRQAKLKEAPWLPMAFWREASVASRAAEHGCGVPVYDFGWDDHAPYIVMQLMEGNFAELVRQGPLPITRACKMLISVAFRLHRAHLQGIVHCDLKPSNILIHQTGAVYPSDFSSSADMTAVQPSFDLVIGTLPYMAPEQLEGKMYACDCRTDLYALGVVAYELLTGRKPFEGSSREELVERIRARELTPLRELRPEAPEDLCSLIDSALSLMKSARPRDAREFALRLRRALRSYRYRRRRRSCPPEDRAE